MCRAICSFGDGARESTGGRRGAEHLADRVGELFEIVHRVGVLGLEVCQPEAFAEGEHWGAALSLLAGEGAGGGADAR